MRTKRGLVTRALAVFLSFLLGVADAVTFTGGLSDGTANVADWTKQGPAEAKIVKSSEDSSMSWIEMVGNHGNGTTVVWTEKVRAKDVFLHTVFNSVGGQEARGGGLVWRVQDRANHYLCQVDPVINKFRLFVVKDAKANLLDEKECIIPDGDIEILCFQQGDGIFCAFGARSSKEPIAVITVTDDSLPGPGGVGFWGIRDAVTVFKEFTVLTDAEFDQAMTSLNKKSDEREQPRNDDKALAESQPESPQEEAVNSDDDSSALISGIIAEVDQALTSLNKTSDERERPRNDDKALAESQPESPQEEAVNSDDDSSALISLGILGVGAAAGYGLYKLLFSGDDADSGYRPSRPKYESCGGCYGVGTIHCLVCKGSGRGVSNKIGTLCGTCLGSKKVLCGMCGGSRRVRF